MKTNWNSRDIPHLEGKRAIVTGANSGIGYFTALELARAGAAVVIACRDHARGSEALDRMRAQSHGANISLEVLDLASLSSVREFSGRVCASNQSLDILVNNAGVMAVPNRELTQDGFEMQFGTNHLGHFALTGLLLKLLLAAPAPRVVTVSSAVTMWASLDLKDLQSERNYRPMKTYGQSKLANLLFMLELDRRARSSGLVSVGSHPGTSVTNLQRFAFGRLVRVFGQPAERGALPSLYAASAPEVIGGSYFGPRDWFGTVGAPAPASIPRRAQDAGVARALWEASEALTGVRIGLDDDPPAARN
jgi:NAD(P)-dependent dehydrogenase (short-subunit alcohol dehydrogenase family)